MALTMLDKHAESSNKVEWPPEIAAEFEREKKNPNPMRRQRSRLGE